MKRPSSLASFALFGLFGLGSAVLAGCPVYPDSHSYRVCNSHGCYDCPSDMYADDCPSWTCDGDFDCPSGYACDGRSCVPKTSGPDASPPLSTCTLPIDCPSGYDCGKDYFCHAGDCGTWGCPNGSSCTLSGGTLQCTPVSHVDGGVDSGPGDDAGAGVTCSNDTACKTGERCLDGQCTPPADQCWDGTQCPTGSQCVDGACTPSCSATNPCPTGYSCNLATKVCTGNATPCGSAPGATTCGAGTVCTVDHCVPPCGDGGTCSTGFVCVGGGCIPEQRPKFACSGAEGQQDQCLASSICLHHSCYLTCDPDAGTTACKNADKFPVCTAVQSGGGAYHICGTGSNFGTQCDPTQANGCPNGAVCIDGSCR